MVLLQQVKQAYLQILEDYNMRIYIAGKITGNPNYKEQFAVAEERLKAEGHQVINPTWKPEGLSYKQYIDMGFYELMQCDVIYLLNGWENSAGARFEHIYALTVKLKVRQEKHESNKHI